MFQEDKDRLEKIKLPGQSNWHYNINHGGSSSWTLQGSIYKNIFSFFHLFFLFGLIWESSTIFCLLLISNRTLGSWWHFVGRSLYICLSMEHYSGNSIKFQITFLFKLVLHFINYMLKNLFCFFLCGKLDGNYETISGSGSHGSGIIL